MNGFVDNPTILAHFHHNGVEEDNGINRIKTAILPDFALCLHGFGDVGNQSSRDLYPIEFVQLGLNVASGRATSIER